MFNEIAQLFQIIHIQFRVYDNGVRVSPYQTREVVKKNNSNLTSRDYLNWIARGYVITRDLISTILDALFADTCSTRHIQ